MVFIDSIEELQYYNPLPGNLPCYCEAVVFPNDILLQAPLNWNGSGNYILEVQLLSADGQTVLENDIEPFFRYYFFVNPTTGRHTFTLQLNTFTPAMCADACFILHVVIADGVSEIFNKFTERYCITECCDFPRNIVVTQDNLVKNADLVPLFASPSAAKVTACGDVYLTLRSFNDCYDAQTGKYYRLPDVVLSGSPFVYHDISNFRGIIQQIPREIERTYSFNCRLQRVSSTRLYELKSLKTLFPAWKINEIENQLHAQYIFVENERYEFNGGGAFNRVIIPLFCTYMYNLVVQLNDCNIFQIFGCGDICATSPFVNMSFVVTSPTDLYYNDNKQLIGDSTALVDYFTNLPNVESVTVLNPLDYSCDFSFGITVETNGFVPNSIFAGGTSPGNRVYSLTDAQLADVCSFIEVPCGQVIVVNITSIDVNCDSVTVDSITAINTPETMVDLTPINNWVDNGEGSILSVSNGVARLELSIFNTNYPALNSPFTLPGINDIIALIGEGGRPFGDVGFTFPTYSIIITTEGNVIWSGYPTGGDLTASTIDIVLTYNL